MAQCQVPCAQMVRHLFDFYLYLAEDVAKIPQVPKAPCNVNPALAITRRQVGPTMYYTIFLSLH